MKGTFKGDLWPKSRSPLYSASLFRYVIVGCSHDSWAYGAGDPGIGLAVMTEMTRAFAASVQAGWRPRRSILFISWDANLYAHAGVSHWLQVGGILMDFALDSIGCKLDSGLCRQQLAPNLSYALDSEASSSLSKSK
jgi:hypothetical protein